MTRILSIDGGGIRGLIPATVLASIEQTPASPSHSSSTSSPERRPAASWPAASPFQAKAARHGSRRLSWSDMYVNEGHRIFPTNVFQRVTSLFHEKYPDSGVEAVLHEYLGDALLSNVVTEVFVTAYDIEKRSPVFFRSQDAKTDPKRNHPLWMVARATSAAPTYFEPFKMNDLGGDVEVLVDGGVFANNPAMCAYVDETVGRADPTDVLLVSLGTGSQIRAIDYNQAKDWGVIGWARPILDVVFDGVSDTTDYQLRHILGQDNYFRLQTDMSIASDSMDDATPENVENLKKQGQKLVDDNAALLATICARLMAP